MNKILKKFTAFSIVAFIFSTGFVSAAVWQENGSDIYYNDGRVGVNTQNPGASLHVISNNENAIVSIRPSSPNYTSVLELDTTHSGGGTTNVINFKDDQYTKWMNYYSTAGNFMGYRRATDAWNKPVLSFSDQYGTVGIKDASADYSLEIADTSENGYLGLKYSVDAFIIDENGNVGIGTSIPQEKLDVLGNIKVSDNSDVCIEGGTCLSEGILEENLSVLPNTTIEGSEGEGPVLTLSPTNEDFTSYLQLDTTHAGGGTTNVINFANDQHTKWMNYYSTAGNFLGYRRNTDAWDAPVLSFRDESGNVGISDIHPDFALEVAKNTVNGYFGISESVDGDIFVIDENGYVGVNNPSPTEKLDVSGNIKVAQGNDVCIKNGNCLSDAMDFEEVETLAISPASGDANLDISGETSKLQLDSTHYSGGSTNVISFMDNGYTKWYQYYSTAGNFMGYRRSVDSWNAPIISFRDESGNVGVGDTHPDYALEVARNSDKGYLGVSSDTDIDGDVFVVTDNGNVGIGTSTPQEKLDIAGNLKLSGSLQVNCIGDCE